MSGSKQTGTSTTIQSSDPWSGQSPYLEKGFKRAESDILEKPAQYYPNSTVVGFSGQTSDALQMAEDRARGGSALQTGAKNVIQDTLEGKYMGANPYLDQAIDTATRPMVENFNTSVMPAVQSGFSGKGRYGSGMQAFQQREAAKDVNRQIGDVAGSMAYQNYGRGMQDMMNAAQLAPTLAQTDYDDISKLQQIGGIRESQAGAELQDDINRFNFGQQAPKDALKEYMSLVAGGSFGGTSTGTEPIYRNKTNEMLGGASTLAGIGGTLFGQEGIWPQ